MKSIEEIAYEEGLQLSNTTASQTGYPQNVKRAITGFDSFEQILEVANKYNLEPRRLVKENGWDLYIRKEVADGPYDLEDFFDASPYAVYRKQDADDFYNKFVRFELENCISFMDLDIFISDMKIVLDTLEDICEDEIVVTLGGMFDRVCGKKEVTFEEDDKIYNIGLMVKE